MRAEAGGQSIPEGAAANWAECFREAEEGEDRNVFGRLGSGEGASDLTKAASVELGKWKPGWNGLESK